MTDSTREIAGADVCVGMTISGRKAGRQVAYGRVDQLEHRRACDGKCKPKPCDRWCRIDPKCDRVAVIDGAPALALTAGCRVTILDYREAPPHDRPQRPSG